MFKFHKKKETESQSKQDYVIWYINNQLLPIEQVIRVTTKRIYIKQEAARVFSSEDSSFNKLSLTINSLRTHLSFLLEEYEKERHEVIKMIDEHNLEMAYPAEGHELVQFEIERILAGK